MRNIYKDCALQITLGGVQDGTPNWAPSATDIRGRTRRVEINHTGNQIDTTLPADDVKSYRVTQEDFTITIEGFKEENDFYFFDTNGSYIKHYIKVEIKPRSALSAFRSYTGVVKEWTFTAEGETPQVERIVIVPGD